MLFGTVLELAQVGIKASLKKLKPKYSRMDLFKGLKRMFSVRSVWETAKSALRVAVVALIAWPIVAATSQGLIAKGASLDVILSTVVKAVTHIVRNAAAVGLVLAAADYIVQRRRVMGEMRMTVQEVKEERRQSEGDPQMRGAIRQRQMKVSRNRMLAAVGAADAVLVNPTHYAIALSYKVDRGAPEVVARGAGAVAAGIREEAARHGVPIIEDPPLTRMLYRCCEVGDIIPAELYEAVAHVLAFVFGLGARRKLGGVHRPPRRVSLPEIAPTRGRGRLKSPVPLPMRQGG
jgi:flagellar biosynthetic protein FlhB